MLNFRRTPSPSFHEARQAREHAKHVKHDSKQARYLADLLIEPEVPKKEKENQIFNKILISNIYNHKQSWLYEP